jgi:FAD-dependent oxidoreductase domain-containing protein 1
MSRIVKRFFSVKPRISIIGGGAIGSSIALHLSQSGLAVGYDIVVIERDNSYAFASCMKSCGGIRQQFSIKENVLMSIYGSEFLLKAGLEAQMNHDIPNVQFHQHGYLFLAKEGSEKLRHNHNTQRSCGASWIELLSSDELRRLFPWINATNLTLGSFGHKNEGYFDPWAFVSYMKLKVKFPHFYSLIFTFCDSVPSYFVSTRRWTQV